jgi:hypothetical protein
MTYFQTATWTLHDGVTVLDPDNNFDDDMFYHVALESKFIANSQREFENHKWPFATHYISIANENEEMAHAKIKRKADAIAALNSDTMTISWQRKFVAILEIASSLTELTEEQVFNALYKFIESDQGQQGGPIDRFMNLSNLLKTDRGRDQLEAMYLLRRAVEARIVYEKSDTYT